MSILRSIIKKILIKASGNRFIQDLLEENVQISHILMGVGTGSSEVLSSGERAIFDTLKQRLRAPYCIFDVGSNKGQFLQVVLENIATEKFSIHCFEPGRETFKLLAESFKEDNRIKLNNVGIGKENGRALLYYDAIGSGLASLTKRKLDHLGINFDKSESVTITTIDNYCSENGIDHIHLLKMDIEGHELDALAGSRRMFDRKSIDIVTFEFGGCNVDTRSFFQDFWYFFSEVNMKLFRITPSGYFYPIGSYSEIHEKFGVSNFMAVSNG
jgi:FkbM family methyltransferase